MHVSQEDLPGPCLFDKTPYLILLRLGHEHLGSSRNLEWLVTHCQLLSMLCVFRGWLAAPANLPCCSTGCGSCLKFHVLPPPVEAALIWVMRLTLVADNDLFVCSLR
jgi:hypothetical protein